MKILHCADIHLDSAMTANLDKDKARERRSELLASFKDMVGYAVKECIGVIIIAGDLFDTRNISVGAKKEVYNIIINNPSITFYYLQGNHDNGSFVSYLDEIPANLRITFTREIICNIIQFSKIFDCTTDKFHQTISSPCNACNPYRIITALSCSLISSLPITFLINSPLSETSCS